MALLFRYKVNKVSVFAVTLTDLYQPHQRDLLDNCYFLDLI